MIIIGKDRVDKLQRNNVIYKIDCSDCDSTYIGQTKRKLSARIYEHERDVKRNTETSALALHSLKTLHKFDFKNVHVLNTENNKNRREFLEMLNIHFYQNTINRVQDTQFLKQFYKFSIDRSKKFFSKRDK